MAKVYYVVENGPDYSRVSFFKTEKEALEEGLSNISNFEMGEEPMNDEENDGDDFYHGDELTFKKGILYTVEDGDVEIEAIDEDAAREKAEGLDEYAVAMFFDGFTKGMYGYQGSAADGKGYKWDWDGYEFTDARGKVEVKKETWVVYTLDKNGIKMHQGSYGSKEMAEKAIEISVKGGSYGGKSYSTAREKLGMMLFDEFKEATKKGEATWTYTAESNKINIKHNMKHIKLFEAFVNEKKKWSDIDSYNIGDEFMYEFPKNRDWEDSMWSSLEDWMDQEWGPNAGVESSKGFEDALEEVTDYLKGEGYSV